MRTRIVSLLIGAALIMAGALSAVAADLTPDERRTVSLYYYRGVVNFEAGHFDRALQEFQRVAEIDPYYRDTQLYLRKSLGNLEEYRKDLLGPNDAESLEKGGFDLYFLGKKYYERGDYKRAREAFKAVIEKNPEDKFANYYLKLCDSALREPDSKKKMASPAEKAAQNVVELEGEIAYVKDDIKAQEDMEAYLEDKAARRVDRDQILRKKEKQLELQEARLEEERQDYLANAKLKKRADRIQKESEKWKRMKDQLVSRQPGTPAELTEYPALLNQAEQYYLRMRESLQASRWHSAALNAISAATSYSDALLVYFYGVRSAIPKHGNLTRLINEHVKRSDAEEVVLNLRSMLNLENLMEEEERPFTRQEAVFLSEKAEKIIEWCRSLLP